MEFMKNWTNSHFPQTTAGNLLVRAADVKVLPTTQNQRARHSVIVLSSTCFCVRPQLRFDRVWWCALEGRRAVEDFPFHPMSQLSHTTFSMSYFSLFHILEIFLSKKFFSNQFIYFFRSVWIASIIQRSSTALICVVLLISMSIMLLTLFPCFVLY